MQELVLEVEKKESRWKPFVFWFVVFSIVAVIFFGIGFAVSKYTKLEIFKPIEKVKKSTTHENWFVFESNNYSVEYPKYWEVTDKTKGKKIAGVILGEGAKIDFWVEDIKHISPSPEQKANLVSSNLADITINGQAGKITDYSYKDGTSFLSAEMLALGSKPYLTFWIQAANADFKKTSIEIIKTYKSK